jgi:hypothetical protein
MARPMKLFFLHAIVLRRNVETGKREKGEKGDPENPFFNAFRIFDSSSFSGSQV